MDNDNDTNTDNVHSATWCSKLIGGLRLEQRAELEAFVQRAEYNGYSFAKFCAGLTLLQVETKGWERVIQDWVDHVRAMMRADRTVPVVKPTQNPKASWKQLNPNHWHKHRK